MPYCAVLELLLGESDTEVRPLVEALQARQSERQSYRSSWTT
jgi:hypothetical protein